MLTKYERVLLLILSLSTLLLLNACATPPAVPWQPREQYVQYALDHVQQPTITKPCVALAPQPQSDARTDLMNDDYPWDKYTRLTFVPDDVFRLGVRLAAQRWKLHSTISPSIPCLRLRVSIAEISHGIAAGGMGSENPYVCIKLGWSFENSGLSGFVSVGAASGYVVWWKDRDDQSLIEDYNRTAYVALIRSLAKGLTVAGAAVDNAVLHQATCADSRSWGH